MNPNEVKRIADTVLKGRAVSFREETRLQNSGAFPYFFAFIPYPFISASQGGDANEFYNVTAANAEGPDGILVAASGGVVNIPIPMSRDCNYHLLAIKYCAHNTAFVAPGEGSRERLAPPQTSLQAGQTPFLASYNQRVSWASFLDVSVFINTGRDLYGGQQMDSQNQQKLEMPLPVHAIQSFENGTGRMRLAAQLPKQGLVLIRVTNRWTQDLRVNGHLFGYKVP